MNDTDFRLNIVIDQFRALPDRQLVWVEKVVQILSSRHEYSLYNSSFMTESWCNSFGDCLLVHHAFSNEPFTKDKFEHAMVNTALMNGFSAKFAARGNRGHDILLNDTKISLKTQADKSIKVDVIWISKYMELGKGVWTDNPEQLSDLVELFFDHLDESDTILILRCLSKKPKWIYELVEIPKELLATARFGKLEMMLNSKQMPKPGYCTVLSESGDMIFQLYFDGGSERKLQVKGLKKNLCNVIAKWVLEPIES
jgi:type II restriction enzyme